MASIKDVAKLAGVGIATASRALNRSGYVAPETRQRIEEAAQALHYTPSVLARNLLKNRSGIIAVMVPTLANPFFAEFTHAAEEKLLEYGYKTLICCTVHPDNSELDYLDMLNNNLVDGIITATHSFNDSAYRESRSPIVSLDRNLTGNIPLISSDHRQGGSLAAEHFRAGGCKKVLQICGCDVQNHHLSVGEAHDACRERLAALGISSEIYFTDWNRWDFAYYRETAEYCLSHYPDADGVFASDSLALHVLCAALARGMKVPGSLRLIAYDGTAAARLSHPLLSCAAQDIPALAASAADCLVARISGADEMMTPKRVPVSWLPGDTCP